MEIVWLARPLTYTKPYRSTESVEQNKREIKSHLVKQLCYFGLLVSTSLFYNE